MAVAVFVLTNPIWIPFQYPPVIAAWLTTGGWASLIAGVLILVATILRNRRRSYRFVLGASGLSLLPLNPLAVALLPLTVWVLQFLRRPDVRSEFETSTRGCFRPPLGRLRVLTSLIAGTGMLGVMLFIETDRAEIIVDVLDESITVRVTQDGQEVRILKDGEKRITFVPSGEYELSATGPEEKYDISKRKITLSRNGKAFVTVRSVRKPRPVRKVDPKEHPRYDDAIKMADLWLRLVHGKDYGNAYDRLASTKMRQLVTRDDFVAATKALRNPLGSMGPHYNRRIEFKTTMPGIGAGDYMVFSWEVSFGRFEEMIERLTLVQEDGKWKTIGYHLTKAPEKPGAQKDGNAGLIITNSIGLRLRLIPDGEFLMGSPNDERDRWTAAEHQHKVRLTKPYYIGVYEVTQEEYRKVTGHDPFEFSPTGLGAEQVEGLDTSRFPAESISWHDAVEFCEKLSARPEERQAGRKYVLPTEAQWEFACRAGTTTPFYTGHTIDETQANIHLERTTTVGSFPPNAFGLFDMAGNVEEWTNDKFGLKYYNESPVDDPKGPIASNIVPGQDARSLRGGGHSSGKKRQRSARRMYIPSTLRSAAMGFRVVINLEGNAARKAQDVLKAQSQ